MDKPIPKTLHEFVLEERKFLHDLANPLAVATGMLEAYQDELMREGVSQSEALSRKLTKLEAALQRIGVAITEHRPWLMAIQTSTEKK